jgi:hypothetical protein
MVAKKQSEEEIKIDDKKYKSIRIRLTLKGWLSIFWHADYWYRKSDGVFVKFEGVRGGPLTPKTITELIKEKDKL